MPHPPEKRRHRRFIPSARSNLPIWPATPPSFDEEACGHIVIGIGGGAIPTVAEWRTEIASGRRPILERQGESAADADLLAWFDQTMEQTVVGWRLLLAGPASDILVLSARARAAGMIDEEIRAFAIEDGNVRVHCIHCGTAFGAQAEPGSVVPCTGCGRKLFIHQHLSRRRAALVSFVDGFESGA